MGHVCCLRRNKYIQKICSICKSNNTDLLLDCGEYPYFNVPVKKSDKKKILANYSENQLKSELQYTACKDCGHVQINQIPDQRVIDNLYSNYYSYPSPMKGGFAPERDNQFVNVFRDLFDPICKKRNLKNVLEIGCFDGYVLHNLKQEGYTVTGCDPSVGADIGKSFGLNIKKEKFSHEIFSKNGIFFDVIISRHFIEHTIEPENFILNLEKILKNDGLLIIETPNIQHCLEKGLLEVFSLQHLTLFTSKSINYLLNLTGFKVIRIETTPENLILMSIKNDHIKSITSNSYSTIIYEFTKRVSKNKQEIDNALQDFINRKDSCIAIWGAGGFGIAALNLYDIPPDKINYYIDSDPQKWGMEYLNHMIPIISPEKAKQLQPGLIIITSMYSQSIKMQIREMNFKSSVLTIFR